MRWWILLVSDLLFKSTPHSPTPPTTPVRHTMVCILLCNGMLLARMWSWFYFSWLSGASEEPWRQKFLIPSFPFADICFKLTHPGVAVNNRILMCGHFTPSSYLVPVESPRTRSGVPHVNPLATSTLLSPRASNYQFVKLVPSSNSFYHLSRNHWITSSNPPRGAQHIWWDPGSFTIRGAHVN